MFYTRASYAFESFYPAPSTAFPWEQACVTFVWGKEASGSHWNHYFSAFDSLFKFLNNLICSLLSDDKWVKVELLYLSLAVESQQVLLHFHYRKHMMKKGLRVRHTWSQIELFNVSMSSPSSVNQCFLNLFSFWVLSWWWLISCYFLFFTFQ